MSVVYAGIGSRQTPFEVLRLMGGHIDSGAVEAECADLHVLASDLQGIEVPLHCVPDMIDEFPILFVAAACASGVTRVRGAAELRVKESDRIAVMAQGLRALQATARERRNVFESLMEAVKTHSLGQISHALYEVGGEYRRNM